MKKRQMDGREGTGRETGTVIGTEGYGHRHRDREAGTIADGQWNRLRDRQPWTWKGGHRQGQRDRKETRTEKQG